MWAVKANGACCRAEAMALRAAFATGPLGGDCMELRVSHAMVQSGQRGASVGENGGDGGGDGGGPAS